MGWVTFNLCFLSCQCALLHARPIDSLQSARLNPWGGDPPAVFPPRPPPAFLSRPPYAQLKPPTPGPSQVLEQLKPDPPLLPPEGSPERQRAAQLMRLERRLFSDWLQWLCNGWCAGGAGGATEMRAGVGERAGSCLAGGRCSLGRGQGGRGRTLQG
jgi:hypothetical protein